MGLRRALLSMAVAALLSVAAVPTFAGCTADKVQLRGDWGQTSFTVEIADTEAERARGLMFRETLPRGAGMLFVYERPQPVAFWMKNTLIPLDLIFLDRQGRVTRVHEHAVPGDLTPIHGGNEVFAVLEINAGLARRYGVAVGSQMQHEIFSQDGAVWPC